MKAVALVKPYVKGLRFCPYWWGNPLYMKWVSFKDDEPAGSIETARAE
jgi:hypothetical protein